MEPTSLTNFYDDLKKQQATPPATPVFHIRHGVGGWNPDAIEWKHKAMKNCDKLKDKCCKHILLDMYCKILPLDKDYIDGNMGTMSSDVDGMLAQKGMTPTQYLTSCFESTNSHFVKYLIEQTNLIAKGYMEKEDATLKDAEENDIDLPEPPEPDTDDPEINSQLVDLESDTEYDDFVEKLKKKTIDKIVDDVSNIIAGKKEDDSMTFDPAPADGSAPVDAGAPAPELPVGESVVGVAMDYLEKKLWNENVSPNQTEAMLGLAIRESTLHEFDNVFELKGRSFNEYCTRIHLGKGYVINESVTNSFKDAGGVKNA